MAVPKRKKSKSKRNKRRNSNTLFKMPTLSIDQETGETHLRHFITNSGYYRGKQIIKKIKKDKSKNTDEQE